MKWTLLLIVFVSSALAAAPAFANEKVEWMKANASDLSDLAAFKKSIGNSRIVLLGEHHSDGSTFLMKTRLVKFLHEEMQFDIIVWEASLYDCDRASNAKLCMDQLWTQSEQMQGFYQYLDEQSKTKNQLVLTGIDMHTTGLPSREFFIDDLELHLQIQSTYVKNAAWPEFKSMLANLIAEKPDWIPTAEKQKFFLDTIQDLHRASQDTRWSQYIRNLAAAAKFNWAKNALMPFTETTDISEVQPIRDTEMASNLNWLANEVYPGRKIIVWMNTGHIARHFDQEHVQLVHPEIFPFKFPRTQFVTLGGLLSPVLKDEMYTIGFTAYSGALGDFGTKPWGIRPLTPPAISNDQDFEDLAHRAGLSTAFLDLRCVRKQSDHWLNQTIIARPFGLLPMKMKLPEVFDGLVFFDEMQPSTSVTKLLAK